MLAAVKLDAEKLELREFPMPEPGIEGAVMRVEAAGMCGAYGSFKSPGVNGRPGLQGHENAGIITAASEIFKNRHGVTEGDLVAVEEYVPCYHCEYCRVGDYRNCFATDRRNNTQAAERIPGGFSQYIYLPPNVVLHKLPASTSPSEAALALPIGNGVSWACMAGEVSPGKTVVIQGPGSKGLGATLASKIYGASCIIVTGLSKDRARLEAAKRLGADYTIDVQSEDFVSRIMDITGGRGADAVVDCTTGRNDIVMRQAFEVMKRRGGVVVTQQYNELKEFPMKLMADRFVTLRVCRGHSYSSVAMAIDWIASGKYPLGELITHHYPLEKTDMACLASGGEGEGANAAWVMVNPWMK
jgi:threonine dehydrogenase-like Zn-dependent dehydrogenase